ncbi:Spc24 subunit of Ndc80-domain-containing protein [Lentinula aciculospora]|uniref:Kinetochore protein Spc24 n=1 Tax=Lentinula aciculospora TaxID=153920 RepID=A0A9W9ATE5_9AGAR|nr:Spc24 subunit of Ndc80-domain-containing protein [Lentinula aciculospora]
MSIEISETIKVIVEMAAMMDPEDDYNTIVEAEEKVKASRAQREKELEEIHTNLKALSKTLEAAKQSAKRPKSVPSAETHAATVNELDNSKLSLAKSISDAENMLASQEAELAALKEECQNLEHYDPANEHEKDLDGTALRLKIYRGMGFDIAMDDRNQASNILVRSQTGDVHLIPLNNDQSQAEYTRQLWNLAVS